MSNYWMNKLALGASQWFAVGALALLSGLPTAYAAEVKVNVATDASAKGRVGCALFKGDGGFPMDLSDAVQMWQKPLNGTASCVFSELTGGSYAVAVFQDLNNNNIVDRNFFGIPQEPWAVSNNIRHRFREPNFSESQFNLSKGQSITLNLTVKR